MERVADKLSHRFHDASSMLGSPREAEPTCDRQIAYSGLTESGCGRATTPRRG